MRLCIAVFVIIEIIRAARSFCILILMRSRVSLFSVVAGCSILMGCNPALHEPIADSLRRETPLHFGVHVTPQDNPIHPPERFEGYHTAIDYEVTADELEKDVPVYAVCNGKVVYSGYADGYGGVLVHTCRIDGDDVTVLYGHLSIPSMAKIGQVVSAGDQLAVLGAARSYDSGGNRKHLHFAIHLGKELQMLGYVQQEKELETYRDPSTILPHFSLGATLEPALTAYWRTEGQSSSAAR